MEKPRVLVVGDDGVNSLGLIRSLGEAGYHPDAIITNTEQKKVHLLHSRYLKTGIVIQKEEDALLNALLDYGNDSDLCYLFPTSDFVLSVIDKNSESLRKYYTLPSVSPEVGTLSEIMSKERMAYYAKMAGFSVPKMRKYYVEESFLRDRELFDFFGKEYPLILKSDSILLPGCDFIVVNNEEELKRALSQCIGKAILIQKYIENAQEIAVQCVGFGDRRPPAAFGVIHKIRTSVFAMGTTTYAKLSFFADLRVKQCCCDFLALLKYSGISDIELLTTEEELFFIECNFRNGSYGYAYTKCGYNLPRAWVDSNYLDAVLKTDLCRPMFFINDIGDLAHVMKHTLSPLKWIKDYLSADCRLLFNFRDQKPFWSEIASDIISRLV